MNRERVSGHSGPAGLMTGVVIKLNNDGLAFLEEDLSKSRLAFTFDKILGYKGESSGELRLCLAPRVQFSVRDEKIVASPRPAIPESSSEPPTGCKPPSS